VKAQITSEGLDLFLGSASWYFGTQYFEPNYFWADNWNSGELPQSMAAIASYTDSYDWMILNFHTPVVSVGFKFMSSLENSASDYGNYSSVIQAIGGPNVEVLSEQTDVITPESQFATNAYTYVSFSGNEFITSLKIRGTYALIDDICATNVITVTCPANSAGYGYVNTVNGCSCNAGYTGSIFLSPPSYDTISGSCTANNCTSTQVANSDFAASGSISGTTGSIFDVTCNAGYSGGGTATCSTDGSFNAVSCTANNCTSTQVANSDFAASGSISGTTGSIFEVTCNAGYSGGGTATCSTGGSFNAVSCTAVTCSPLNVNNSNVTNQAAGNIGDVISVACDFSDDLFILVCFESAPAQSVWVDSVTNFPIDSANICPSPSSLSPAFSLASSAVLSILFAVLLALF